MALRYGQSTMAARDAHMLVETHALASLHCPKGRMTENIIHTQCWGGTIYEQQALLASRGQEDGCREPNGGYFAMSREIK